MTAPQSRTQQGFLVSGRVQAVGFRWWTRQLALQIGVTGTVENLDDGRVEVHACGSPDCLDRFRRRLRHGPPGALVDDVVEIPSTLPLSTTGFRILT